MLWKLFGDFAFWALKTYVRRRQRQRWWDHVDTWEVLVGTAEDLSGCKCLETQWPDGHVTRTT